MNPKYTELKKSSAVEQKKDKRHRLNDAPLSKDLELELIFHELAVNGSQNLKSHELVNSMNNYLLLIHPSILSLSPVPHPTMLEHFEKCTKGNTIRLQPYFSSRSDFYNTLVNRFLFQLKLRMFGVICS